MSIFELEFPIYFSENAAVFVVVVFLPTVFSNKSVGVVLLLFSVTVFSLSLTCGCAPQSSLQRFEEFTAHDPLSGRNVSVFLRWAFFYTNRDLMFVS